jgi:HEAT repeat protein
VAADARSLAFINLQPNYIYTFHFFNSGRKMKFCVLKSKKLLFIPALITALFVIGCAGSGPDFTEAENLLEKIASYQYGQSLEPMVKLDEILRNIKDESHIAEIEQMMLKQLISGCTSDGKDQICRRLRYIGSAKSAPVLIEMLNDSASFEISLYALEMIPGPAVDDLLYQEFLQRTGDQKVRLINIMGIRSIQKAIPGLEKLLYATDGNITSAVISALGRMPAEKSIAVLMPAIDKTSGDVQLRALNAVIQKAENLSDTNQSKSIWLKIYQKNYPVTTRLAALRQILIIDPEMGTNIMIETISANNAQLRSGIFGLICLIPEGDGLNRIIANSAGYEPHENVQLIRCLTQKTGDDYSDFFLDCARSKNTDIRTAALYALRYAKKNSVVPFLLTVCATTSGNELSIARESLYRINAQQTDDILLNLLEISENRELTELIKCIGERQVRGAASLLIASASNDDVQISRAAIRSLKSVAETEDINDLNKVLLKTDDPVMQNDIISILQDLVVQVEPIDQRATGIIALMPDISDTTRRIQLMQILGASGNPQALPILTTALTEPDENIEKGAIKAVELWPDDQPADILLNKIKNGQSEANRILAFRGYLTLLTRSKNTSDKDLLLHYRDAIEIAPVKAEQKKVFSAISAVNDLAAIDLAMQYLADNNLRPEAETAIVEISRKIFRNTDTEKLKKILQKIIDETKNESIREDALELVYLLN